MNDSNSNPSNDGASIVIVLLLGAVFAGGAVIGQQGRESDRALIQSQEQQITELQTKISELRGKLDGYKEGRR